jgi:hypothetical protein
MAHLGMMADVDFGRLSAPFFAKFTILAFFRSALQITGWYGNNCDCSDHCKGDPTDPTSECAMQIAGDVNALVKDYNFDAWKLDGCGGEYDLVAINKAIKVGAKAHFPDDSLIPYHNFLFSGFAFVDSSACSS